MIPAEVGLTSLRVDHYNEESNDKELCINLDLLDEVRIGVEQRLAWYQNLMTRHYNKWVRSRRFNKGELVLRRVMLITRDLAHEKLGPNWEGPYKVVDCFRRGIYHLKTLDRRKLPYPWNTKHLRKYYQ